VLRGHFAAPRQFRGRAGQTDEGAARAWTWANALCGYKLGDCFEARQGLVAQSGPPNIARQCLLFGGKADIAISELHVRF
jgi:hypothetical protein